MINFTDFLKVIEECDIHSDNFSTFMAVTKEHCLDKGITDYEAIKKNWLEFKMSLNNAVKNMTNIRGKE